ncbi:FGGY family carbohydrate kinase [Herbiconiux sp.]|uniref:FGGY family carbohydrate kinase n=1 Tax=Herbiconiux sp. TaxID=1871186 RepID=UPI0025B99F72|nr:FGGY family carbohydrate kinase [Herbiconiux sp.]
MTIPLLLGIDIGTSRIKANLIDPQGRSVAIGSALTPFRTTPDGVEMTAGAFLSAVREAVQSLGSRLSEVRAVGIASMGETGTLVTPDGPGALPLIAWHDKRGEEVVEALRTAFGDAGIRSKTGREGRTVTSIAKLGWLGARGAELEGTWLGVAGLVAWRLTGGFGQEASLAATSGAYDPYSGSYDADVLAVAGVSDAVWTEPFVAGTPVGTVHGEGSRWSGIPVGAVVTIAGHDHPVGVLGAGGTPNEVIDSMGTGEPIVAAWTPGPDRAFHPEIAGSGDGHITVSRWPGTDRLMLLWETLRPGMGLATLLQSLGSDRLELENAATRRDQVEPVSASAIARLESGILPPALDLSDPVGAWVSVLEGYALLAAQGEASIRGLTGTQGPIILIGGGLRSPRWVEAKRRRATHPVLAAREPEAVSRGAALLAGVAAGWWDPSCYPPADIDPVVELLSPVGPAAGGTPS